MANWLRTLKLTPEYSKAQDGDMEPNVLCGVIAGRLRCLTPFLGTGMENIEMRRIELADEFDALASDPNTDTDDVDALMNDLYDWADITLPSNDLWNARKVCWVETFI